MPIKFRGFRLRCKVCVKTLGENEDPIDHIAKHDLTNYFDLIPVVDYEYPGEEEEEEEEEEPRAKTPGEAALKYAGVKKPKKKKKVEPEEEEEEEEELEEDEI